MKHSIIIFAMLTIVSSVAFATLWLFDPKTAPTIPLPNAYGRAMTALGSATNEFHCTDAKFNTPGTWFFSFYSTNGALKTVEVSTNSSKVVDGVPPTL
jgi:hypothetical protein